MPELPEIEILIDAARLMVVLLVMCIAVGFAGVAATKGMLCCK